MKNFARLLFLGRLTLMATLAAAQVGGGLQDGPSLKQRQDCEVYTAKAQDSFNRGAADKVVGDPHVQAEHWIGLALESWPECYLALEWRSVLSEKKGDLHQAVDWLLKARAQSPDERWGYQYFHLGRLYYELQDGPRAVEYLLKAQGSGIFPVQTNYLLGLARRREGDHRRALDSFQRASLGMHSGDSWPVDSETLQANSYYLGEQYMLLGAFERATQSLESSERGPSPEVRRQAWRVHHQLSRFKPYLTLDVRPFFDSSVTAIMDGRQRGSDRSQRFGQGAQTTFTSGYASGVSRRWGFGFDFNTSLRLHTDGDLQAWDRWELKPQIWGRYTFWNHPSAWEIRAGYQFYQFGKGRFRFLWFERDHDLWVRLSRMPQSSAWKSGLEIHGVRRGMADGSWRSGWEWEPRLFLERDVLTPAWRPFAALGGRWFFPDGSGISGETLRFWGLQCRPGLKVRLGAFLEMAVATEVQRREYRGQVDVDSGIFTQRRDWQISPELSALWTGKRNWRFGLGLQWDRNISTDPRWTQSRWTGEAQVQWFYE